MSHKLLHSRSATNALCAPVYRRRTAVKAAAAPSQQQPATSPPPQQQQQQQQAQPEQQQVSWQQQDRRPRPSRTNKRLQEQARQQHKDEGRSELQQQVAVLQALAQWAEDTLPQYMLLAEQQWQPSMVLPDLSTPVGLPQLRDLREEAQKLPTDVLVVLAGLTVHASLVQPQLASSWGSAPVLQDQSGADQHVWARWRRQWAADMNKIRAALSSYCYCCGCIDTRAVDVSSHETLSSPVFNGGSSSFSTETLTVQQSLQAGNADGSSSSSSSADGNTATTTSSSSSVDTAGAAAVVGVVGLPYQQLFRELLQARMVRVMHENMTNLANYHGAPSLARLTAAAATDLKRHELALLSVCCELTARDPHRAVCALAAVVKQGVKLPGCLMDDGWHESGNAATAAAAAAAAAAGSNNSSSSSSMLYQDWMAAADCVGAWAVSETAAAVQDLCVLLKVSELQPRFPHNVCFQSAAAGLLACPTQLRRLSEVQLEGRLRDRRRGRTRSVAFGWVFGRDVLLQ